MLLHKNHLVVQSESEHHKVMMSEPAMVEEILRHMVKVMHPKFYSRKRTEVLSAKCTLRIKITYSEKKGSCN